MAESGTSKEQVIPKDAECLRCHGMKTLAYHDPLSGGLKNLFINPEALLASSHAKLQCRSCHGPGFEAYPHFQEAKREELHCLGCHKDNDSFPHERFKSIEKGFNRSIHFRAMPDRFSCFSCHNPHEYHTLSHTPVEDLPKQVSMGNQLCLKCHSDSQIIKNLTGRKFSDLLESHDWLPSAKQHWSSVRCIECHTGSNRKADHFILGKEFALKECESCHRRDSVLLTKLYQYQSLEERQKGGFINALVLNNAYIIGMTRNVVLDWFGLIFIGMTFLGVSAHGLARWMVSKKRNRT